MAVSSLLHCIIQHVQYVQYFAGNVSGDTFIGIHCTAATGVLFTVSVGGSWLCPRPAALTTVPIITEQNALPSITAIKHSDASATFEIVDTQKSRKPLSDSYNLLENKRSAAMTSVCVCLCVCLVMCCQFYWVLVQISVDGEGEGILGIPPSY